VLRLVVEGYDASVFVFVDFVAARVKLPPSAQLYPDRNVLSLSSAKLVSEPVDTLATQSA
jgi:hypothetical protein